MSKEIVVPGELISTEQKQIGVHTFAREGNIYSDCLGIKNESDDRISVVPLRGRYIPLENDVIIGVVKNEKFAGYDIEINSFYPSFISNKDIREPMKVGSVISAKIVKVTELNEAELGMVRTLSAGEVVSVTPVKVPRIIGKNASMLNAVKNGTGSTIMVGRNGLVWITGGDAGLASDAILRIEEYSHAENLTDDIQRFLAAKTGQGIPGTQGPSNEDAFESGFGGGFHSGGSRGGFGGRGDFRPRNNFRRPGGPGMGRGGMDRGGGRGMDRGGDRGMGGPSRGFGGNRNREFAPRNNFNRGFSRPPGGRPDSPEGGFQMNRRFGSQFENQGPGFDKRKRFPRNDRVRGDEDPVFE